MTCPPSSRHAKVAADNYILATVFQIAVLGMACALLVGDGGFVLSLPPAP